MNVHQQFMNKGAGLWTVIKVEQLRELWADGLTTREIAVELGRGFTRNAVIGKAWRLRLKLGPRPKGSPQVSRPNPAPKPKEITPPAPEIPPPRTPSPWPQPRMRRLQLVDLELHHCRWGIGDPHQGGFYFCAADALAGQVYCPFHFRMSLAKQREA